MPLDNFSRREVEYTTFLGTNQDEILVKLKGNSSEDESLHFLVFSAAGNLKEVRASDNYKGQNFKDFYVQ